MKQQRMVRDDQIRIHCDCFMNHIVRDIQSGDDGMHFSIAIAYQKAGVIKIHLKMKRSAFIQKGQDIISGYQDSTAFR